MLKEIPYKIGLALDTRLRSAIYEFGKQSGATTISDTVRTLIILGLERTASVDSSVLKAGYRAGVNMGLGLIKERLMTILDEEMSRVDATDDLTASGE